MLGCKIILSLIDGYRFHTPSTRMLQACSAVELGALFSLKDYWISRAASPILNGPALQQPSSGGSAASSWDSFWSRWLFLAPCHEALLLRASLILLHGSFCSSPPHFLTVISECEINQLHGLGVSIMWRSGIEAMGSHCLGLILDPPFFT